MIALMLLINEQEVINLTVVNFLSLIHETAKFQFSCSKIQKQCYFQFVCFKVINRLSDVDVVHFNNGFQFNEDFAIDKKVCPACADLLFLII